MKRHEKVVRYSTIAVIGVATVVFILVSIGTAAHAAGLVDDTINTANEYSKYGLENYQLDFYVDNSWGWLPWNWSDGLGKSVMYGLYAITNFIWTISLYLSNATGYLIQEAYQLDFISDTANAIGKNMQTLAGITQNGFSSSGFYVGFLLLFILVLGIYVTYTGLIKRETTKAIQAIMNFLVVFLLSASFIAYAPSYIEKINDFSKDISTASLEVGTKIVLPNSSSQGKDSVDMIRDSLFAIQVKQPWLLLQYGATDIDEARTEKLLSVSPNTNNGKDRETVVIDEIENQDNANLSLAKVINRLGTVFFLVVFNIGISIFVFLLTGMMIFSQVLFIIFAMFLPISFLLSMIPSFDGMGKRAITKLFNVIMTRAGLTLVVTVAFSISSMLYSLAGSAPFFMTMFLQVVTFAGIYFKLGDIMNLFALQSNDSQGMGRQLLRRPRMFMTRQSRRLQRTMRQVLHGNARQATMKAAINGTQPKNNPAIHERENQNSRNTTTQPNHSDNKPKSNNLGAKTGAAVGNVLDIKNRAFNKATELKDTIKDAPTNAKYALYQGQRELVRNATDFSSTLNDTRTQKQTEREQQRHQRQAIIAQRRLEMEKAKQARRQPEQPVNTVPKEQPINPAHKRPMTSSPANLAPVLKPSNVLNKTAKASVNLRPTVNPVEPKKPFALPEPAKRLALAEPKLPRPATNKTPTPAEPNIQRTTTVSKNNAPMSNTQYLSSQKQQTVTKKQSTNKTKKRQKNKPRTKP
ncbi:CD3337/EF1877 family mobilome membrane protein [Enterococcus ratti]|uniref:YtxH domain-containing protein n=1 Tax=Enterococcus ratti TaxID=150033 RepID=A0A1L8WR65_9ENTE|nr:hypothetical protein [Enterococcus ratti]OJG83527.1 hypothetical protein RV14_GL001405 [Enterococcus ratti]